MAKKYSRGPNKAKVLVCDPRYRSRQEKPAKGKGSYRREAFSFNDEKASVFLAA
ncbi:alternative ribosome rescue factor ArfA [uncultured Pseudomonas sp.]|uniref:alternative ribosome rescue factor ArfA n=1 Tax=uncultured Pseudomonas sp. TaxID=114707 RepID=UPI0025D69611|nr:alternative ribosome rescue factor ArfA [uncultured Pseudomonas sp.]